MSKVLLVNGSSRQEGNTSVALAEVAAALEGHGIETETMWLGNKPSTTASPAASEPSWAGSAPSPTTWSTS